MQSLNMDGSLIYAMKLGGAVVGSTIALVFKPLPTDENKVTRWIRIFHRFWIGVIMGFIFSPIVLDFFGWMRTPDYWLAAATLAGSLGVVFLQIIYSDAAADAVRKRFRGHQ